MVPAKERLTPFFHDLSAACGGGTGGRHEPLVRAKERLTPFFHEISAACGGEKGGSFMKDLTLTQEYFICAVNDKGKLSSFNVDRLVCLLASGMLELQLSGCISIDGGKKRILSGSGKSVSVTGPLPEEKAFLRPLYDYLNQGKPVKMEKILEDYHYSFSGRRLNALIDSIGESLAEEGLAQAADAGLFEGVRRFLPTKDAINRVVDLVRSELLEEGEVTEDIAALVILLEKSGVIREYFSRYEQKEMKERLAAITKSPEGAMVKEMLDYVNSMLDTIAVLITVFS